MIADLHTIAALQNTIASYLASQEVFRTLYPGLATSLIDQWYATLADKYPKVRAYAAHGTDQFPLVIVQLAAERANTEPLQAFGRVLSDGRIEDGALMTQTLSITTMAGSAEIARAISVMVRAALIASRDLFLKAGYIDYRYTGAEALLPEEELIAEDMGVFMRRQSVDVVEQVRVPPLGDVPASKTLLVLSGDLKASLDNDSPSGWAYDAASGTAGGVDLQE